MTHWMTGQKLVLAWILAISLLIGALLIGGYVGFDLSEKLNKEQSFITRTIRKAKRGYGAIFLQGQPVQSKHPSNRLNLKLTTHAMPLELRNAGGGISADGSGGVLIMDSEGRVFRLSQGHTKRIDVIVPNSNVDALKRQLKDGALGNIDIQFSQFRYNDILLHSSDSNSYLLISYSEWHEDQLCYGSTLAKSPLPSSDPSTWSIQENDWEIIFRTEPCLKPFTLGIGIRGAEAGGRMVSWSNTEVLWTSGVYRHDDNFDKANPEVSLAQDDEADYGKVLMVDIEQNSSKTIAKGLRNPQGIDIDQNGHPLVTDHGMRGGDELNLVFDGANFGFPLVTLGTKYSKEPGGVKPFHTGHLGYDKPLISFVPSIAPSSVLSVQDFHPNWNGDILIGGLKRKLHRVYIEDGVVLFVEPIDLDLKIRDMARVADGQIALYTDDNKVVYMEPAPSLLQYETFQSLLAAEPHLELRRSTKQTFDACLECHGFEKNDLASGPTLYQACGRAPESDRNFNYSGALSANLTIWDETSIAQFVSDPEAIAPGTSMAWGGIGRSDVAELLAKSLCQLTRQSVE